MTHEELIEKTKNYEGDKLSFIDGAEWMQGKIIEEVCEWLGNHSVVDTELFKREMVGCI